MKFSEQVVLGSTLIKFQPFVFLQGGCGCLIGMAGAAIGEDYLGGLEGSERLEKMFPWIFKTRIVRCPLCWVTHHSYGGTISCVAYHVHEGIWTFDRAIAYIRSIEPWDDAPPEKAAPPDSTVPVWCRDEVKA